MKKLHAIVLVAIVILGCSQNRTIDASNENSFKTSVEKIRTSLDGEQKKEFDEAMTAIMSSGLGYTFDPNSYHEEYLKIARTKLDGKTAKIIIIEGKIVRADKKIDELEQIVKEVKAFKAEKAMLEAEINKINKDFEELKKFTVIQSKFYFNEKNVPNEPCIELKVENNTPHIVYKAYFLGELMSHGRSKLLVEKEFSYKIPGGLEPGKKGTWQLAQSMFSEWAQVQVDQDNITLEVTPLRIDDIDGKPIYNIQNFQEDLWKCKKRLHDLVVRMKELNEIFKQRNLNQPSE